MIETEISIASRKYRVSFSEDQREAFSRSVALLDQEARVLVDQGSTLTDRDILLISGLVVAGRYDEILTKFQETTRKLREIETEISIIRAGAQAKNSKPQPSADQTHILDTYKAEIDTLRARVLSQKTNLEQTQKEKQSLELEKSTLAEQLAAIKAESRSKYTHSQDQIEQLYAKLAELEKERTALEAVAARPPVTPQNAEAEEKLKGKQVELEMLRTEFEAYKNLWPQKLRAAYFQTQEESKKLRHENADLRGKLAERDTISHDPKPEPKPNADLSIQEALAKIVSGLEGLNEPAKEET